MTRTGLSQDHVEVVLDALVALLDDVDHGAEPWEIHHDFNPTARIARKPGYEAAVNEAITVFEAYRTTA